MGELTTGQHQKAEVYGFSVEKRKELVEKLKDTIAFNTTVFYPWAAKQNRTTKKDLQYVRSVICPGITEGLKKADEAIACIVGLSTEEAHLFVHDVKGYFSSLKHSVKELTDDPLLSFSKAEVRQTINDLQVAWFWGFNILYDFVDATGENYPAVPGKVFSQLAGNGIDVHLHSNGAKRSVNEYERKPWDSLDSNLVKNVPAILRWTHNFTGNINRHANSAPIVGARLTHAGDTGIITFWDQGPGMHADMFNPFKSTHVFKIGGKGEETGRTGLGLKPLETLPQGLKLYAVTDDGETITELSSRGDESWPNDFESPSSLYERGILDRDDEADTSKTGTIFQIRFPLVEN